MNKIKMWYQKPRWWQFRKKRYYRNILTTNDLLNNAPVPTNNRWGIDDSGEIKQFTDKKGNK